VFFALALAQERFANAFAPGLALTLGAAAHEARAVARRRLPSAAGWALEGILAVAVAAALLPALRNDLRLFEASRFARAREGRWLPPVLSGKAAVEQGARWLRDASPPTRGFLDSSLRPEYGVLTSWDDGHLVRYRAERPTVQDGFGSYADRRAYELAARYYDTEDEEAALRVARELGARYAFATSQGSGQSLAPSPRSVAQRLWRRLGSAGPEGPALARHRLLWLQPLPEAAGSRERDRVALFELVEGAVVEGDAAPGARVSAELSLATSLGPVRWRADTHASEAGRYALRLPYATDAADARASAEVRATGTYRLRAGAARGTLALRDEDVRAGARVAGPSLR
jgi:asparagine N-glycosylation enzyme membrane subunit Stt3